MTREEFLAQYKTKEWYELSKRIKARDHNTCQMCGRNDVPLSVHHLQYGKDGSIFDISEYTLITLCDKCHEIIHRCRNLVNVGINELRCFRTDYEIVAILGSHIDRIYKPFETNEIITESSLHKPIRITNPSNSRVDYLGNLNNRYLKITRDLLIKQGRYKNDM